MTRAKSKGFTLIELLVVIAIIGLLSSVVLASLNTARARARDAQRISNVKQIQTALELYYSDTGSYPTSPDNAVVSALSGMTPTYIGSLPTDLGYRYYNNNQSNAQYYAIHVPFETKAACYVCGGNYCGPGVGWWGVNICN